MEKKRKRYLSQRAQIIRRSRDRKEKPGELLEQLLVYRSEFTELDKIYFESNEKQRTIIRYQLSTS
jgi:hypothetical protein